MEHQAKIVATLGPASESEQVLEALIDAGVNVFRLNMSHGSHDEHRKRIWKIRQIATLKRQPIAILADFQGPKLRTGVLKDHQPLKLQQGETVTLTSAEIEGHDHVITTSSEGLIDALHEGSVVLMDDGRIRMKVLSKAGDAVTCEVTQGGLLSEKKGINVPDAPLSIDALTDKDRADILFALQEGVDYLAQSFVRNASDVVAMRTFIRDNGFEPPPIVAKIEKPEALNDIDAILEVADVLMVARGDLGVEESLEKVPVIQKQLVDKANLAEKPIIIATQMLETMIESMQPTRAEVSDVANAIFDGADAVMLSGETAVGKHPVEVVKTMRGIIEEAEKHYLAFQHLPHEHSSVSSPHFHHAIAHSASYAARKANVEAIVVLSQSGKMAQRVSKLKPQRKLIALTEDLGVYNRLSLLWGVHPLIIPFGENTDQTLSRAEAAILEHDLLKTGDSVVFCAGSTPLKGATNMLKIFRLGEFTEN